ncbi:cytokine receptor family member b1 [Triplophysa dalaica]|uniref:cytokine receptor family member b1 n=1 Tax=Triplophysa dalaica TaxID=1582913 RepID=UPI0024DF7621|nr:cytokine receptor family member b1 [Triplophysa dalaica]
MKTMLELRLLMFLYFPVLDAIPAPVTFKILSHNFKHILQWSPGINSSTSTVFNLKQRCGTGKPIFHLNIRNTTLDVSQSLVDIYTQCTFSIWASLDNETSSKVEKSITPYEDTVIGPPTVFLSGCGDCLKINVSLPRGSGKKNDLDQFYNSVYFNLNWKKAGEEKVYQNIITGREHVLQNLKPHDKYCIRVLPKINSNRNTRSSDWQCEYTSKEEFEQVLYIVGGSVGAVFIGLVLLMLASSLFYTGFICRVKTLLPKGLRNIVKVYYLNPEWTVNENVLLSDVQMTRSKNDPTRISPLLYIDEASHKKQHKEDGLDQADTEDDEEYDEEDEEGNFTYMGCMIKDCDSQGTSNKEDGIVSALPLLYSSSICSTGDKPVLHLSPVTTLSPDIHSDEDENKVEVMSEVSGEKDKHPKLRFEPEGNADVSNATGNVNLFSVTLRPFGSEEHENVLHEDKRTSVQKELYGIPPPVHSEMKTDDPITKGSQKHLFVFSFDPDIQTIQDTKSSSTATVTGDMHEQDSCSYDETDDSDTGYIMR